MLYYYLYIDYENDNDEKNIIFDIFESFFFRKVTWEYYPCFWLTEQIQRCKTTMGGILTGWRSEITMPLLLVSTNNDHL